MNIINTPKWHTRAGKIALKERGWTEALIRDHLPSPEARGGDLCRPPRYGMNPYWTWATVLKIEPTIADKLAKQREIMSKRGELTSDSTIAERIAKQRKDSKKRHERSKP